MQTRLLEVKCLNVYSPFHTSLYKIYLHSGSKTGTQSWNLKVNVFGIIFLIEEPIVLLLNMHSGYAFYFLMNNRLLF